MRKHLILVIYLLVVLTYQLAAQSDTSQVTVILSLDGFRWDYPLTGSTPNLNQIASKGVKAVSLIPSFPSKTFPNHYTMATGLVPDHHGLVNNTFFDAELGLIYSIGNAETRYNPAFYGGEPIWVTAKKQGVKTASFYWVGSELPIKGIQPDYWKKYDESVSFSQRIDTVISWLRIPKQARPRLIMAYYHEPDAVGHHFGPDAPETLNMIHQLDSLVGVLFNRIQNLPDANRINFIVVSDHGMAKINPNQHTTLREFIPENWPVQIIGGNPNYNIYAEANWIDSCYSALQNARYLKVWRANEVPEQLNYGHNSRVGGLIVVADSSSSVTLNKPREEYEEGTHGYDVRNTDIHAIFYAIGPAFKQGYVQPAFINTNIYAILAYLLSIEPVKTDGNINNVIGMFK